MKSQNIWIAVLLSVGVIASIVLWKWTDIKKALMGEQPVSKPPADPWGNGAPTDMGEPGVLVDYDPNTGKTKTNTGSTTPTTTPTTPTPTTTKTPKSVNLNAVFTAKKSEENRLAQLILQAVNVKEGSKLAKIVADGYFGAKSTAAYDKFFPYQRNAKPFTLRTLMEQANLHYGIVTDGNGNMIDPASTDAWAKWKNVFLPK